MSRVLLFVGLSLLLPSCSSGMKPDRMTITPSVSPQDNATVDHVDVAFQWEL